MKVPKRYLVREPKAYKVIGLSFKPVRTDPETTQMRFKVGDWDDPIHISSFLKEEPKRISQVH